MRQQFLIRENHPCLLIFFAGWGMDEHPFRDYRPVGCDWMICYDYRSTEFDFSLVSGYESVRLVAWSMGVWAASQVFAASPGFIGRSVAVNGTIYPVNGEKGILPDIFYGTLNGLNEQTLGRFYRRMCGCAAELGSFRMKAPRRSLEELRDELEAVGEQAALRPVSPFRWDRAIVGSRDKIFLPSNQLQAWSGLTEIEEREIEHYSEACIREVLEWTNN